MSPSLLISASYMIITVAIETSPTLECGKTSAFKFMMCHISYNHVCIIHVCLKYQWFALMLQMLCFYHFFASKTTLHTALQHYTIVFLVACYFYDSPVVHKEMQAIAWQSSRKFNLSLYFADHLLCLWSCRLFYTNHMISLLILSYPDRYLSPIGIDSLAFLYWMQYMWCCMIYCICSMSQYYHSR